MAPGSPATLSPWSVRLCVGGGGGCTLLIPSRWPEVGGQPGAGAVSPGPILAPLATKLVETRRSRGPWTPSLPLSPRRGFLLF